MCAAISHRYKLDNDVLSGAAETELRADTYGNIHDIREVLSGNAGFYVQGKHQGHMNLFDHKLAEWNADTDGNMDMKLHKPELKDQKLQLVQLNQIAYLGNG